MSRAAAIPLPLNNLYLVVGHGPSRPVLTVSNTPVSGSITITRNDYHVFCLYMLHIFRVITEGSSSGLRFGTSVRINDALKEVLYFLYADIARLVAPTHSEHEQLEQTALALYSNNVAIPSAYYQTLQRPLRCNPSFNTAYFNPAIWNTPGRSFFDMSAAQRVTISLSQLFDLTLNAVENLDDIRRIINRTRPEDLSILLNASSTATINHLRHLNIQRSGTPLQMALYGGDEDIVAYLKTIMDPAEFERQSKEVFRNALPLEIRTELDAKDAPTTEYHNAMLIVQKAEAEKLCDEALQFCVVDSEDQFTVNDVTVADFQKRLMDYVRNNPMHNPAILHRLYEIHEKLPGVYEEDCLFSEQVLGYANALSSARWLQHYAQGIYYLGGSDGSLEPTRRSFICRDSNSPVDIRSFIPSRLGIDSFVSILGRRCAGDGGMRRVVDFTNFCQAKTASFQSLLRSLCEHATASVSAS